jgi:hypothetical protein
VMRSSVALTLAIAALALVTACGGGDKGASPSASPTAQATVEPTAAPGAHTNIPEVDALIVAVEAQDVGALVSRVSYTQVACEATPQPLSGVPPCTNGQSAGSLVPAFPMAACEGAYDPADRVADDLRSLLGERIVAELYGVYGTAGSAFGEGGQSFFAPAGAEYVIVFDTPGDTPNAWGLLVNSEGIVGLDGGCAEAPEELVANRKLTDVVLTPQATRTGVPGLDAVIDAVQRHDIDTIASMIRLTDVPCIVRGPSFPSIEVIECGPGQLEGTPVKSFMIASCEGTYMQEAAQGTDYALLRLRPAHNQVYAVYQTRPRSAFGSDEFPHVDYAVMLTTTIEGHDAGLALLIGSDGVVGIDEDCGLPPDQMAELSHFGDAMPAPGAR